MSSPRVLELFCGIGGLAAALGTRGSVVAAVDIDRSALDVYQRNFPYPTVVRTIESIPLDNYRTWDADLWWLSPPCQPYTRRGRQRDLEDPRAAGLLAVIQRIGELRPAHIALENVPPFADSHSCHRLRDTLLRCGYHVREQLLCPTELGIPNRRRRFYVVASQQELLPPARPGASRHALAEFLDASPDPVLSVPPALEQRYAAAIDIVDGSSCGSSCFTAAYGRSPVRSGSYLRTPSGLRRFSPREIARLLGFPDSFRFPASTTHRQAWKQLGNSLSVIAVRHVLTSLRLFGEAESGAG